MSNVHPITGEVTAATKLYISPAFQFYGRDFLATSMEWSMASRGLYISMLSYQWINGTIPINLSGLFGPDADHLSEPFIREFQRTKNDRLQLPALETLRAEYAERAATARANGKKGGRPTKEVAS